LTTMHEQVVNIVDNFHDDPLLIREAAIAQNYAAPQSQQNAAITGPIARRTRVPDDIFHTTLAKLTPYCGKDVTHADFEFRYSTHDTIKRQVCHPDQVNLAGIVYLTLPEHCQGGTWFFRHRPSGHYFNTPGYTGKYNYRNADEWECVYKAEMKFNRLAFYPGRLFHAVATPFFGDNIENARLTENMFVDTRDFNLDRLSMLASRIE